MADLLALPAVGLGDFLGLNACFSVPSPLLFAGHACGLHTAFVERLDIIPDNGMKEGH